MHMEKGKSNQEQESNITVAIRIRPLSNKQINSGDADIIRVQDNLIIILDPLDAQIEDKRIMDVLHRSKQQRYAFDKIYRFQSSQVIYMQTTQKLIQTVLNGYNSTCFAYGPTGTGKTYTMLGNQEVHGLNVLAIKDIFHRIDVDQQFRYQVFITYVQIYNQMIRDLLVPTSGYLQLRDDPQKGVVIAGVTQFKAESTEQVMNLLLIGNRRRTTQATNANQTSSRSHAVFQIGINKVAKTKNTKVETLLGKLSLIDLAGSERGTVTQNRGIRLLQGAKINRSLLALANCINALGDKNKKGFFVPYRDSKLTRLLKDSLGGNCKTVMIVNVSPSSFQFQQTVNTLKYANRAKNIKTKAITNKKLVSLHISEYKNIINDLHRQIQELKYKLTQKGPVLQLRQNLLIQNNKDKLPRIDSRHGMLSAGGNSSNGPSSAKNTINTDRSCEACGRINEKEQMKTIKEQIFENFNQRIQLRRAMMEIQQQNALNILEIRKKQGDIVLLKNTQGSQQNQQIQRQIKDLTRVIVTLKLSTNKNSLKKQITNLQIMQSMTATKKIRQDIMKKVKSKENRDTLEIIIKNHILQLQNIQLEINLQIQQRMIQDMRQIIQSQRQVIQQNNLNPLDNLDDDLILGDQIEIQIQDDENELEEEQNYQFDDQDMEVESYKNFEFQGKKNNSNVFMRNNSAKKDINESRKKKDQLPSFKKKDYNNNKDKDRSLQKAKQQQQALGIGGIGDFGLKGVKMNVKRKR